MANTTQNRRSTYTRAAILLHWVIAALVMATIPIGWYGATYDTARGQSATDLHKSIGILILLFTLVRIGWRLTHRPPALPESMTAGMRWAARITHSLFYALLVILPLSGWWMSSAVPERHSFGFGLFDVPFLPVPRGWASAGPAHFVHTNLAWLMVGLVVLHFLAVLKHVLFDDDDLFSRMMPAQD